MVEVTLLRWCRDEVRIHINYEGEHDVRDRYCITSDAGYLESSTYTSLVGYTFSTKFPDEFEQDQAFITQVYPAVLRTLLAWAGVTFISTHTEDEP